MDVDPGTIVVWSDIACPWATLAIHRLRETRARLGLDGAVSIDHRAFPLELFNERPTSKRGLESEIPAVAALSPGFGWRPWRAREDAYPSTTLLALEAVQAAKEQGLLASEMLDYTLRRAWYVESKCISMRHVILEAATAAEIDVDALAGALDDGRARATVMRDFGIAKAGAVTGSPHLFLPDGSDAVNPGVAYRWPDEMGYPIVERDEPEVFDSLLRRAAARSA